MTMLGRFGRFPSHKLAVVFFCLSIVRHSSSCCKNKVRGANDLSPIVTDDSYTGFSSPSRAGCIAGVVFFAGNIIIYRDLALKMRTSKNVFSNVLHSPRTEITSLALSALSPFCWKLGDSIGVSNGSILTSLFAVFPLRPYYEANDNDNKL